ncbi:regulator [Streptomyces scopuliridis RB72]|uniref:Regulator n=1 Tax=Streptomyces scopuliridis RB72 TaxID=1440053 RepID=A0A2T7SN37_9ACTN|nr:regulator [Streptomyces scopuliridis RB72]
MHEAAAGAMLPAPRQLLSVPVHFTNRRDDMAALDGLFANAGTTGSALPLIVVSGSAGVGKTTLVSKWLRTLGSEFPDGHLYVDLRGHTSAGPADPAEALGQFLRALGAGSVPADLDELSSLWRSYTAGLRIAVMLDNAFTAAQIRPLLPGGRGSLVVVTSRRTLSGLGMDGAKFHRLQALDPDDGVELLTRGIGKDRVANELPAARRIVALCAGLPLAVCLVSARLASRPRQPVESMACALTPDADRLDALEMEGEATVRNALDASYAVLTAETALVYRTLGLLPLLTFDALTAAAACAQSVTWAERCFDELIEANLMEDTGPDTYRFHDLVRVHARDRATADDTDRARGKSLRRTCDWYLQTATAAQARLTSAQFTLPRTYAHPSDLPAPFTDDVSALAWLDAQRLNLMAMVKTAARSGWHATAWQLVDALWPLFLRLRHYNLWFEAHEIGLDAARHDGNGEAERQMLNSGAIGLSAARRLSDATVWYGLSLEAAREAGDARDEGQALLGLGTCHREAGELTDAVPYLNRAITVWEDCGYPRGAALARIVLGEIELVRNNPNVAVAYFTRAHDALVSVNDPHDAARSLAFLGHARAQKAEYTAGTAQMEEALAVFTTTGAKHWQARTLEMLGRSALKHGDNAAAEGFRAQALALYEITSPADARRLSKPADQPDGRPPQQH